MAYFSECLICHSQGKMIMQDKLEKERNDAKNAVEEYVYEMRDKLSGEYDKFVSEDVSMHHSVVPISYVSSGSILKCVRREVCVYRYTVK